jgi:hypothetical protein
MIINSLFFSPKPTGGKSERPASLSKCRQYPPMSVHEFRVVVDTSLTGLGYQLRICGADVSLLPEDAPHSQLVQVS